MNYMSTPTFYKWLTRLKDASIRNRLLARFDRIEPGNFGDFKQIDNILFELRFFFAGGLRIYDTIREGKVVLLLAGGDKSSQAKDIAKSKHFCWERRYSSWLSKRPQPLPDSADKDCVSRSTSQPVAPDLVPSRLQAVSVSGR
jgi:putative addiction module killer protein